jgi:hypothetical protein
MGASLDIQPQVRFTLLFVRTMALKAIVRKQRSNRLLKVKRRGSDEPFEDHCDPEETKNAA